MTVRAVHKSRWFNTVKKKHSKLIHFINSTTFAIGGVLHIINHHCYTNKKLRLQHSSFKLAVSIQYHGFDVAVSVGSFYLCNFLFMDVQVIRLRALFDEHQND